MYGLIAKLTTHPGKRPELIQILSAGAAKMPGCLSYVIAEDRTEPSTLWITETWESREAHDASFQLRAVQEAMPLIANLERVAETRPVWSAEPH